MAKHICYNVWCGCGVGAVVVTMIAILLNENYWDV